MHEPWRHCCVCQLMGSCNRPSSTFCPTPLAYIPLHEYSVCGGVQACMCACIYIYVHMCVCVHTCACVCEHLCGWCRYILLITPIRYFTYLELPCSLIRQAGHICCLLLIITIHGTCVLLINNFPSLCCVSPQATACVTMNQTINQCVTMNHTINQCPHKQLHV